MTTEKIEAFWENATADDVAKIANTRKSIPARVRDENNEDWQDCLLVGWKLSRHLPGARWIDADGAMWDYCQVYREPSWHANKPDPGPGFRLLGKHPDEELKPGDECFSSTGKWDQSYKATIGERQSYGMWYRRRIEPVEPKFAVGQTVKVIGPKERTPTHWDTKMDKHIGLVHTIVSVQSYPKHPSGATNFYSVDGISNWAFREDYLEPVEPEPKHYVLRAGDSCETPCGNRVTVLSQGSTQRFLNAKAGDTIKTIHGQTITITAKGFEVTE
jgi:hypothetical protein